MSAVEMRCEVCDTNENLRGASLMTGEPHGQAQRPICRECYMAWYASGEKTVEGILRYRMREQERRAKLTNVPSYVAQTAVPSPSSASGPTDGEERG